ncbi:CHAT domain-containing protein [Streptomyces sp. NPDC021224]|uniref:CHAT domain-containing protein n=1 Tax=unclassified Streptomyces TaxID=2593676 RepID=UPI0037AD534B
MTAPRTALAWRLAAGPGPADVEPLCVRWPEHGEPEVSSGQSEVRRLTLRRLRALRLELAADGGLVAHWGRGGGGARWPGAWARAGAGASTRDTPAVEVTAGDGRHSWLDGWLVRSPAGTRLEALCLSPGNGGTWPAIVRVGTAMLPVPPLDAPARAAGPASEPWGRVFAGHLLLDRPAGPPRGLPFAVAFGPGPRGCRAAAATAMELHSTGPAGEGAVRWAAHCTDSAEFTVESAGPGTGAGEYRLTVRYGPEHEDTGAPDWNAAPDLPLLAGLTLPVRAGAARAAFTLRGHRLTGTLELAGRDPFNGAPLTYRARLEAEACPPAGAAGRPLSPSRELADRWRALSGPLPGVDLRRAGNGSDDAYGRAGPRPHGRHLQAADRAALPEHAGFVRLFQPLDLAVGLVHGPSGDTPYDGRPRPVVLTRATTPPTEPDAAVQRDRVELRALAERLTLQQRYAEARPLLSQALRRHQEAAAAATWSEQRRSEEISVLRVLDHQALCDCALHDHRALVGRLGAAARLRGRLASGGPPGAEPSPLTGESAAGTLLAMLDQAHRLGYWRSMLGTDEERVGQVESVEPFHRQLVTVLLDLGEPVAALLAAEAGRARAFADLLGRAAPPVRTTGTDPDRTRPEPPHATAHPRPGTPAHWAFGSPPPLNAAALYALLARHGHPVVAYFLTGDRLVRWIWTPGSGLTSHVQQLDARALARAVDTVGRSGRPERGSSPDRVREALRWLGALLWPSGPGRAGALLPADPDRPVTVVPHGILARVPFAALPDRSGRPLVHRHALCVLPGISLLEGLLDRQDARGRPPAGAPRLLAFVDPEPMPAGLPPLPWTRTAFPRVATWYGEGRSRVYSGTEATASRLAEEAAQATVLCLATHAKAYGQPQAQEPAPPADHGGRARGPMDSYAALARTPGHSGLLRARDLPELSLGADLVILSACEGGAGRVTADGVIGLGRSFLVRGPTAVLLALAPVGEEDSLDLVYRFHEHWLHEGGDRAAALRRAQAAYAEMYPDAPERWAWFALLGLGTRGAGMPPRRAGTGARAHPATAPDPPEPKHTRA